ncbi:hypothetical protein ACQ9A0_26920, partial [Escherichia coli]
GCLVFCGWWVWWLGWWVGGVFFGVDGLLGFVLVGVGLVCFFGCVGVGCVLLSVVGSVGVCGGVAVQAAVLIGLKVGTPVVGGLFDVVSTA